jgi:hypothetical protein
MSQPSPDEDIAAVRSALDLTVAPSLRRRLRNSPLPDGIALLLRIATDDPSATEEIAKRTQMHPQKLREAAAFYIEQILLAPNADSYRVLGARRNAPTPELRRNLALLCKWLHSADNRNMAQSMFFLRITHAWNNLKTPERRASYDATLQARTAALSAAHDGRAVHLPKHRRGNRIVKPRGSEMSEERGRQARVVRAGKRGDRSLWRWLIALALGPWAH